MTHEITCYRSNGAAYGRTGANHRSTVRRLTPSFLNPTHWFFLFFLLTHGILQALYNDPDDSDVILRLVAHHRDSSGKIAEALSLYLDSIIDYITCADMYSLISP